MISALVSLFVTWLRRAKTAKRIEVLIAVKSPADPVKDTL